MSRDFQYPVLFKPDEEWMGHFDEKHPEYVLVKTDLKDGVCVKVIHLEPGIGRREVCSIRSLSYTAARELAYRKYQDDLIQRGLWED